MVRTVQITVALGALLGLVLALDSPAPGGPCRTGAAACVGRSFAALARPYATHALLGAAAGLAVGAVLLLAWRGRPPRAAPPRRRPIPERVRHEVWRRDRGACVDCGSRARLEFDHIVPVSRGGSSTARNVELRCEPCNRGKGARI
jgi:hypothetical protein